MRNLSAKFPWGIKLMGSASGSPTSRIRMAALDVQRALQRVAPELRERAMRFMAGERVRLTKEELATLRRLLEDYTPNRRKK